MPQSPFPLTVPQSFLDCDTLFDHPKQCVTVKETSSTMCHSQGNFVATARTAEIPDFNSIFCLLTRYSRNPLSLHPLSLPSHPLPLLSFPLPYIPPSCRPFSPPPTMIFPFVTFLSSPSFRHLSSIPTSSRLHSLTGGKEAITPTHTPHIVRCGKLLNIYPLYSAQIPSLNLML